MNPLARNPGFALASAIYFILFTWASPYGTHMEPGCTAHMGPIWIAWKLCCRGFVLALFQSTTAYKIDSEHTRDYMKLFPVCKVEILQVTVNTIEVLSSFNIDF